MLALMLVALGMDLVASLEAGALRIHSLGESWTVLTRAETAAHPAGVGGWLLRLPAFAPFAILALLIWIIVPQRRRRRLFRKR